MQKKNNRILQEISKFNAYLKLTRIKNSKRKENEKKEKERNASKVSKVYLNSEVIEDYKDLIENIVNMKFLLFFNPKVSYAKIKITAGK